MEKGCAICADLNDCHEVTEEMIAANSFCRLFHTADQGVLEARADVIRECGLRALRYEIPKKELSARKARRRKGHV